VAPEYNHGYPAVLKNALDHVYAGWNKKPMGFVSYGGSSGGIRAVQQLRQVAIELQLAPLRDEVNIAFAMKALAPDGTPTEAMHQTRLETLLDELTWWGQALQVARAK
jgi:NAD(P)H-dependent FMN reductase